MIEIILGLGSNLGDRANNLRQAVRLIEADLLEDVAQSHIYKSAPLLPENAPADWNLQFYNIVIAGKLKNVNITALDFLARIKEYEIKLGRRPTARWAPREIDIDILSWGHEIIDLPDLKIPHPEMYRRDFVMKPLLEIRPEWRRD